MAGLALVPLWTGPWPLLHLTCDYLLGPAFSLVFHITIDLLGNFDVQNFYFGAADDPTIPMSEIQSSAIRAAALCIELSQSEETAFWALSTTATWAILGIMATAKIANPWLEGLFLGLCAWWYISFVNYVALVVRSLANETPLTAVLTLAKLAFPLLFGICAAWLNGGSTAWQWLGTIFDSDIIFDSLAGQSYRDIYKWRVSLYLTVIQITAIVFLTLVCFGLWTGAL